MLARLQHNVGEAKASSALSFKLLANVNSSVPQALSALVRSYVHVTTNTRRRSCCCTVLFRLLLPSAAVWSESSSVATDSSLPSSAILVFPPDAVGDPGRMRKASHHHPTDVALPDHFHSKVSVHHNTKPWSPRCMLALLLPQLNINIQFSASCMATCIVELHDSSSHGKRPIMSPVQQRRLSG